MYKEPTYNCSFCGTSQEVHWIQGIINPDTKEWGILCVCNECSCDKDIRELQELLMFEASPLNWAIHYGNATKRDKDKLKKLLSKYKYNYKGKKFNLEIEKECKYGVTTATKRNTRKKKISIFI